MFLAIIFAFFLLKIAGQYLSYSNIIINMTSDEGLLYRINLLSNITNGNNISTCIRNKTRYLNQKDICNSVLQYPLYNHHIDCFPHLLD